MRETLKLADHLPAYFLEDFQGSALYGALQASINALQGRLARETIAIAQPELSEDLSASIFDVSVNDLNLTQAECQALRGLIFQLAAKPTWDAVSKVAQLVMRGSELNVGGRSSALVEKRIPFRLRDPALSKKVLIRCKDPDPSKIQFLEEVLNDRLQMKLEMVVSEFIHGPRPLQILALSGRLNTCRISQR